MHEFGRFPQESLKDLARVAVIRALQDAGIGVKEVEAVYSANGMAGLLQGQEQIRGQAALRDVGIERVPIVNVENACASASTAFREATIAIRAGVARVVLVVGFEKMFVGDRDRSLDALATAADLDVVRGLGVQFTAIYAMRLRKRLDAGALQFRHLVDVSVKSHANGALNPYAQHRTPVTAADVEDSRPIAEPLTLLMCSSFADGAAAAVLMADDHPFLARSGKPRVIVRAAAAASGFAQSDDKELPTGAVCTQAAYREASLGPADIQLAEVHDAMAPGELLYYEQLGLCAEGEAGALLDSGDTKIGGRVCVNPSGGLSSRGHPVGATGLAQIAEVVWQLRGEAGPRQSGKPRIGLTLNSGGWLEGESAACNVHILERASPWT
jgi:acetyl-CoA acetyltransferase